MENRVLRVCRLDTVELDSSLLSQLKQSIVQDSFKYMQSDFYQRYHAEIFAGLKLLLWYHTYYKRSQTVAQSIFDWAYVNTSPLKTLMHACFFCLDEWFEERFLLVLRKVIRFLYAKFFPTPQQQLERNVDKFLSLLKLSIQWISFANYMSFLVNGRYLNLWERLLGLTAVYKTQKTIPNLDHEISQREFLWQTYFSLFKLVDNIFDLNKFYRRFSRKSRLQTAQSAENTIPNQTLCAICGEQPTMVHCASNYDKEEACRHVFCYYCIRQALNDSRNQYECELCSKTIRDCEMFIKNKTNNF